MARRKTTAKSRGRDSAPRGRGAAKTRPGSPVMSSASTTTARGRHQRKGAPRQKLPPDMVIVRPDEGHSPYAERALDAFSAGVQEALLKLARSGVEAVVIEEGGRRIRAIPSKIAGRYVVVESPDVETRPVRGRRHRA